MQVKEFVLVNEKLGTNKPKNIRTEDRGDFNIHGTKYFYDAVFHQKSKIYDVVSLLYLWLAKKPVLSVKY